MKTFSNILKNDIFKLENILTGSNNYFAHRKDEPVKYELLSEHLTLTLNYSLRLIEANKLEVIINNQITEFVIAQGFNSEHIAEFIKEMFISTIYFHDFGKINENFQLDKMNNSFFVKKGNGIGSKHSILSSHLFLLYYFNKIYTGDFEENVKILLYYMSFLFVHSIDKHHGSLSKPSNQNIEIISNADLCFYSSRFSLFNDLDIKKYFKFLNRYFYSVLDKSKIIDQSFLAFSLVKLNSSLLTASDYYSTNEFMIGLKVNEFGVISSAFKDKIINNIKEIEYNKELYANFERYESLSVRILVERNNSNLNKLRQSLSAEAITGIRLADSENLFYIEAPTGAGKTNLSLLALGELLSSQREITKVFYVFPFTTLITQTFNSIKENLSLNNSEIAEIHSKAQFNIQDDDGTYGNEKLNYIDSLFVNFPITLISHVGFFDILTSISKEKNYILHRLVNSIVIIDEMQTYPPTEWDKINYLIQNYSKHYNITFIIMSATLPKISRLLIDKSQNDKFNYLIKNRDEYFRNPNFLKRVEIEYILRDSFTEENLRNIVLQKSAQYTEGHKTVKTIVEFITKKRASEFYELLKIDDEFSEYEIFLISGTILEPRRQEIISYLKSAMETKVIVVTTQVIEAGVDIDMDIGFKDKSLIDSEEQIAGRINRNAKKSNSKLYIFYSGDVQKVYRSDLRYKLGLNQEEYLDILHKKNFDYFYHLVFENINRANENEYQTDTLPEFKELIKSNNYIEVDKSFRLIRSNSLSIFVPLRIGRKYFSAEEIRFLENFFDIHTDVNINGFDVWNIYEKIIKNKLDDFISKKINLKIISSIISKFTFSIWKNPNEVNRLLHFGEEKYGFLMLDNYESIYSFEDGLKSDIEKDINFIGF
ncbi:MAG: CRISPR-associated helicase Cas3' [Melioribacteraceae bacterium]|nr:CRISPR-associated helicase Cas3' [Melioribacteraceae bacterium]